VNDVNEEPEVLYEVVDRIATITLNRPKARNALNSAVRKGLVQSMVAAEADDEVSVIILTGSDPAFCAGIDLKELSKGSDDAMQAAVGARQPGVDSDVPRRPWPLTSKPVIGAINGVAVTGGFELAIQCDFLIASELAQFGDTHTRVGILPGWGLTVLLPQMIGQRRAIEMSLTGNFMGAQEALQFGLVNHVVAHQELLPTARKLATDIAGNNPRAVRTMLASYRAIHTMTVGDGLRHETQVGLEYGAHFDPTEFAGRREAITNRGRSQVG
jgi:enoyl-CoA hydratase